MTSRPWPWGRGCMLGEEIGRRGRPVGQPRDTQGSWDGDSGTVGGRVWEGSRRAGGAAEHVLPRSLRAAVTGASSLHFLNPNPYQQ